jgi:hypothetical protein
VRYPKLLLTTVQNNSGLIAVGNAVGFILAIPFTTSSDRLAAYLTKKNGGIREAEMRLGVMLPGLLIGPAGLILYGYTAQEKLHWIGYMVGVAMVNWSAYFYFTFTLAYAVDSYTVNLSEMLIAVSTPISRSTELCTLTESNALFRR